MKAKTVKGKKAEAMSKAIHDKMSWSDKKRAKAAKAKRIKAAKARIAKADAEAAAGKKGLAEPRTNLKSKLKARKDLLAEI